jgi:hypothetical protein
MLPYKLLTLVLLGLLLTFLNLLSSAQAEETQRTLTTIKLLDSDWKEIDRSTSNTPESFFVQSSLENTTQNGREELLKSRLQKSLKLFALYIFKEKISPLEKETILIQIYTNLTKDLTSQQQELLTKEFIKAVTSENMQFIGQKNLGSDDSTRKKRSLLAQKRAAELSQHITNENRKNQNKGKWIKIIGFAAVGAILGAYSGWRTNLRAIKTSQTQEEIRFLFSDKTKNTVMAILKVVVGGGIGLAAYHSYMFIPTITTTTEAQVDFETNVKYFIEQLEESEKRQLPTQEIPELR